MSTRRTFLRVAGLAGVATLAGCTAIASDDPAPLPDGGGDGPGGSQPSDLEHPRDATHRVVLGDQDAAPDLPVRPHVELADPYVTAGSPPVLQVTVENPTDSSVVVGEYRDVVFQYVYSEDGAYVCLPHSERSTAGDPDRATPDYAVAGDGCWQLDSHPMVTEEYGTVEIPAGGELTAFVGLYTSPDAGECVPLGDYRLETTYASFPDGLDGDDPQSERWGLSLTVEEL